MKIHFVETQNTRRLAAAINDLTRAQDGTPSLGLLTGDIGLGKSWALDDAFVSKGIILVRAVSTWRTANAMFKSILKSVGVSPAWSTYDNLNRVVDTLKARAGASPTRSVLAIDEADYLMRHARAAQPPDLLEAVRDIHDLANTPILLVGEPDLAAALEHNAGLSRAYRRFWDRILVTTEFLPVTASEISRICLELTDLKCEPAAAAKLAELTEGNLRRVNKWLVRLERMARANAQASISADMMDAATKKFKAPAPASARQHPATRRRAAVA
ncbi:MAG: ATP-binding protein [Desulfarculaceae bacterium]|jgi:DNA transposition AAA+ family ATPase